MEWKSNSWWLIASLTNIDHKIARFHLIKFFASFWPRIHQFSWWMDHWTRVGQSKFKFAKSSHTASKTGRVVNSVRTPSRTLCLGFFLFALEIFAPGLCRVWADRAGVGVRGGELRRRRRTGNRGVITGLCTANHCNNSAAATYEITYDLPRLRNYGNRWDIRISLLNYIKLLYKQ